MGARFKHGRAQAIEEQDCENGGIEQRLAVIGFDQPVEVKNSTASGDVDEAMEILPAFAAEAADPSLG